MAHTINKTEWQFILSSVDGRAEHERAAQQRLFRVAQAVQRRDFVHAQEYVDDGAPMDIPLIMEEAKGGPPGAKSLVPETLHDYEKLTILSIFAAQNEPEKLAWLIDHGSSADMVLPDGRDAAWVATEVHANEAYEYLAQQGIMVNSRLSDGSELTRLMAAVLRANVDVVHHLLRKKAKVNAYDRSGRTALHHNLARDPYTDEDVTIAQALLAAGANPNIEDNDGIPAHALAQNEVQRALMQSYELGQVTEEARRKMHPEPEPEYPEGSDPGLPQIRRPQAKRPRI